eukprot:TRINITY_DN5888_c0_g1_i1.p1 TRINITY_DN5888_c0_g1~~TRINITY_DN5888_c0_g1_i1.p1  ORF type:complete len:591 (+),score=92.87 TRINITY_DN5888_c0_g1_i1:52-1824(+)
MPSAWSGRISTVPLRGGSARAPPASVLPGARYQLSPSPSPRAPSAPLVAERPPGSSPVARKPGSGQRIIQDGGERPRHVLIPRLSLPLASGLACSATAQTSASPATSPQRVSRIASPQTSVARVPVPTVVAMCSSVSASALTPSVTLRHVAPTAPPSSRSFVSSADVSNRAAPLLTALRGDRVGVTEQQRNDIATETYTLRSLQHEENQASQRMISARVGSATKPGRSDDSPWLRRREQHELSKECIRAIAEDVAAATERVVLARVEAVHSEILCRIDQLLKRNADNFRVMKEQQFEQLQAWSQMSLDIMSRRFDEMRKEVANLNPHDIPTRDDGIGRPCSRGEERKHQEGNDGTSELKRMHSYSEEGESNNHTGQRLRRERSFDDETRDCLKHLVRSCVEMHEKTQLQCGLKPSSEKAGVSPEKAELPTSRLEQPQSVHEVPRYPSGTLLVGGVPVASEPTTVSSEYREIEAACYGRRGDVPSSVSSLGGSRTDLTFSMPSGGLARSDGHLHSRSTPGGEFGSSLLVGGSTVVQNIVRSPRVVLPAAKSPAAPMTDDVSLATTQEQSPFKVRMSLQSAQPSPRQQPRFV